MIPEFSNIIVFNERKDRINWKKTEAKLRDYYAMMRAGGLLTEEEYILSLHQIDSQIAYLQRRWRWELLKKRHGKRKKDK